MNPLSQHCSIMQPTFVPWAGYFSLISLSQHFVFLDDVQLTKQSWQTRNQIILNGKPFWLSVPVFHKNLQQLIQDTEIDDRTKWRDKQIKTIQLNYKKLRYFHEIEYIFDIIADKSITKLSELNMKVIRETCKHLEIKSEMHVSSDFKDKSEDRSQRLSDLCKWVDCNTYISPTGAKEYLVQDDFIQTSKMPVKIFSFTPKPYPQGDHPEFISHLSFLDVVANISMDGLKEYISDPKAISLENL